VAAVVLAAATWLTKLEYAHLDALTRGTGLALLVARNLTLVGLYVLLAVALRQRTIRGEAAAGQICQTAQPRTASRGP
jgi:hypothetical protein